VVLVDNTDFGLVDYADFFEKKYQLWDVVGLVDNTDLDADFF
jgi:hypothetical protein